MQSPVVCGRYDLGFLLLHGVHPQGAQRAREEQSLAAQAAEAQNIAQQAAQVGTRLCTTGVKPIFIFCMSMSLLGRRM